MSSMLSTTWSSSSRDGTRLKPRLRNISISSKKNAVVQRIAICVVSRLPGGLARLTVTILKWNGC